MGIPGRFPECHGSQPEMSGSVKDIQFAISAPHSVRKETIPWQLVLTKRARSGFYVPDLEPTRARHLPLDYD